MSVYILKLKNNKYYVGYSHSNISDRITKHLSGRGSSWTKLYKPLQIIETIDGSKELEREYTLIYMRKYGWENVRGAGWTAVNVLCPNEFRYSIPICADNTPLSDSNILTKPENKTSQ